MSIHLPREEQWLEYTPGNRQGTFVLPGDFDSQAEEHYWASSPNPDPSVETPDFRRIASFVHFGTTSGSIDSAPTPDGWVFSASGLRRDGMSIAAVADAAKRILTGTEPSLPPFLKGIEGLPKGVKFGGNQARLVDSFEPHIIFEDPHVLAINKPPHVSSVWDSGHHLGANEIAQIWRGPDISTVHRLDRLTSGVLLMGKNTPTRGRLSAQFANKSASALRKLYVAVVDGNFGDDRSVNCYLEGSRVTANLHGRSGKIARTTFKNLATVHSTRGQNRTVLGVQIHTGRKHQIRASLAEVGHPIVDDPLYNTAQPARGRMRLHAYSLSFTHPWSGDYITVKAPLPPDFFAEMAKKDRLAVTDAVQEFGA